MKKYVALGLILGTALALAGIGAYYQGTYSVEVNVNVGDSIAVPGNVTATGDLYIGGGATVNGSTADDDSALFGNDTTPIMFWDAGALRVGINDSTPSKTLDVNGTCQVTGAVTIGGALDVVGDLTGGLAEFTTLTGDSTTVGHLFGATAEFTTLTGDSTTVGHLFGATAEFTTLTGDSTTVGHISGDTATFQTVVLGDGASANQDVLALPTPTPFVLRYYDDIFGLGAYQGLLWDAGLNDGNSASAAVGSQADADSFLFSVTHTVGHGAAIWLGYSPDLDESISSAALYKIGTTAGGDLQFDYYYGGLDTAFMRLDVDGSTVNTVTIVRPTLINSVETAPCDGATTKGWQFTNNATGEPCFCNDSGDGISIVDGTTCID